VLGAQDLPRGARVRVRLGTIDEVALDVAGTVVERLDSTAAVEEEPEEAEAEHLAAGPIAIAVDVNETDEASQGASGHNPAS
jgi:exoribonuclease-2